jgi:hypothetical protein
VNAIAPVVAGLGAAARTDMRADFAAALGAHGARLGAPDQDQASSCVPGWPVASEAVIAGRAVSAPDANDMGGAAMDFGGSAAGRASGPPSRGSEDGGEVVMGTIMLDGHPVGNWMGNRMAREAGRPGAGTTSFDPRQAPAWTPSGAL